MKKFTVLILAVVMVLSLAACAESGCPDTASPTNENPETTAPETTDSQAEAQTGGSVTVTDMIGRTVTIDGSIERIVVNEPGTMELVLAVLGDSAIDKIAAVGRNKSSECVMGLYSEKYPQLGGLPGINDGMGFDAEAIIALEPNVFIVNTWFFDTLTETIDILDKAGIPTVILDLSSDAMASPQQAIGIIGEMFGEEDSAQEMIAFINEQLDLVRDAKVTERTDKPTVYIEKGSGTSDTYDVTFTSVQWAYMVEEASGDNIAVGVVDGDTQIDPEYLITSDPDFIFIAGLGFGADIDKANTVFEEYTSRTGWDTLTAVQNADVYEVAHLMSRSPMCFYPTLEMAKLFYPDVFADVDPAAILQEYFDRYMYLDYDQGLWFNKIDH